MRHLTLAKEILLLLTCKLLLLWLLWTICFSHPVDHLLTADAISSHVFNPSVETNYND